MRIYLAICLITSSILRCHGAELPELIATTKHSIVGVGTHMPTRRPPSLLLGTGFVVGNGRMVVTNDHVVKHHLDRDNLETVVVFTGDGMRSERRSVTVLSRDIDHDLALLSLSGERLPALLLSEGDSAREGDRIFFTGFPIGAVLGLYPVTHRGMISAIAPVVIPQSTSRSLSTAQIRKLRRPFRILQLDAVAYPGNSGSPLMNASNGQVIGILNSVYIKRTKEHVLSDPSGISYAIPVSYLRDLLNSTAGGDLPAD